MDEDKQVLFLHACKLLTLLLVVPVSKFSKWLIGLPRREAVACSEYRPLVVTAVSALHKWTKKEKVLGCHEAEPGMRPGAWEVGLLADEDGDFTKLF
ncbi:hypothetical protein RUM44_004560 [Polyplax serrata]|uniref:Uncharacterized protein n=1 Tax=Polyplax serrata TaxID=468196 RepID=A0ABR1B378_POLSC